MSIQVEHIEKRFNQFAALHDINITFPTGELVALLGPSGCGKTTLLLPASLAFNIVHARRLRRLACVFSFFVDDK